MVRRGGRAERGQWDHRSVISSRDGIDTGSLEQRHERPAVFLTCCACGPSPAHSPDSELRDCMMGHPEAAEEETKAMHTGKRRSDTRREQSAGGEK